MKAALARKYGPPEVIQIEEVETPIPKDNEILVEVFYSSLNAADYRVRGANFPRGFTLPAKLAMGLTKPKYPILGNCFSGKVTSVGNNVTNFKEGDEVMGLTGFTFGTHAEFVTVKDSGAVIKKPVDVSFEDAAGVLFGGATALYFLRDQGKIKEDESILINGASGAVGTNAIQIAKYFGAKVTAVCSSRNIDLVKSLGADEVIDYSKQDVTKLNNKYDLVMDNVGNISIKDAKKMLNENGRFLQVVADLSGMIGGMFAGKIVKGGTAPERVEDVQFLANLLSDGKLKVVIGSTYDLDNIVEAHRDADKGHKVGNTIIKIK